MKERTQYPHMTSAFTPVEEPITAYLGLHDTCWEFNLKEVIVTQSNDNRISNLTPLQIWHFQFLEKGALKLKI